MTMLLALFPRELLSVFYEHLHVCEELVFLAYLTLVMLQLSHFSKQVRVVSNFELLAQLL